MHQTYPKSSLEGEVVGKNRKAPPPPCRPTNTPLAWWRRNWWGSATNTPAKKWFLISAFFFFLSIFFDLFATLVRLVVTLFKISALSKGNKWNGYAKAMAETIALGMPFFCGGFARLRDNFEVSFWTYFPHISPAWEVSAEYLKYEVLGTLGIVVRKQALSLASWALGNLYLCPSSILRPCRPPMGLRSFSVSYGGISPRLKVAIRISVSFTTKSSIFNHLYTIYYNSFSFSNVKINDTCKIAS